MSYFTEWDEDLSFRFWSKVEIGSADDCWNWKAGRNGAGYGAFGITRTRIVLAHRLAYEGQHGKVPVGAQVHHRCERPTCVNPSHLEALMPAAHVAATTRHNGNRGACVHGHVFTVANTYITKDGRRRCRTCNRERARRNAQRRNHVSV